MQKKLLLKCDQIRYRTYKYMHTNIPGNNWDSGLGIILENILFSGSDIKCFLGMIKL